MSKEYSYKDIVIRSAVEHIRKRPKMYTGTLDHQGWSFMTNRLVEHFKGILTTEKDWFIIKSDSFSFPEKQHPVHKKSYIELLFTTISCGGADNSFAVVLCALSSILIVEANNKRYQFNKGILQEVSDHHAPEGCIIYFKPDKDIWSL